MRTNPLLAVSGGSPRSFEIHTDTSDPLAALLPAGNPRYLQGAWSASDLARIGAMDRVLVLGTVRLSVDAVLALHEQGIEGPFVSCRRGACCSRRASASRRK